MKRTYLFILLCAAITGSISVSSCSKDFLEKPKGGAVTTDTIFHTVKQANYAIAQMYNLCIKGYFPGNNPGNCRPESITDQLYILHPAYSWAAATINTGTYVTGNMSPSGTCDPSFSDHYRGIRQANLVFQNVDLVVDGDENWKKDVRGQALFCRAMQHYELFRYYAGIPIVSTPLDGTANLQIPRASVASVVDSIVSWCDQAAGMLPPTRPSTDYGKVTKLAALALKSRVLLYAASPKYNTPDDMKSIISAARYNDARDSVLCYPNYDKERWNRAAQAAKDVLNHAGEAGVSLYNTGTPLTTGETYATLGDYESVYNVYANQELILVNTENQAPATPNAFEWDRYMSSKLRLASWGVKNNVPIEFMQLYEKRDGSKFTLDPSGDDFPAYIQSLNLDPRFYQSIAYDGMYYNSNRGVLAYYKAGDGYTAGKLSSSDAGPDGYAMEVYKFVARINNMDDAHFAWPVFRLAEFYLNYAEAINEYSGPNGEAEQYLNLIRARAGMPDKHPAGIQAFREAVQNERTIELAYEGHRYNDLNRWLTAHQVLNKQFRGIATTAKRINNTLKRSWEIVPFINRVYPTRYYYVPFPYAEVSKNYLGDGQGWDGQNPGW
ncbi:RagB/SusD family nutrient uptake outer membrane protein [Chitinophaga caeni]|uniref:RagB/SusD family nutrient uptake outer membrane protein n=1 Tax=Chitinophaga caeni TaxID=2029983 RepID=A0A291QT85_9BACT|nr:RagB/SusD family nutrient uptake outer membrane protein [Chitinophaga caeni]ATL47239.1 RagB/SusD family nutrient uptake outer membrane protein [Chitinophaga caeni]